MNKLAGLLGALKDEQFRTDVGRGLLDAGNRGAVAGLLGGPVDLATLALRPLGYGVEKPVGGSEWIGQKMQDAGLVSGTRNALAEILAAVALPSAAARSGAGLFAAEQQAARNMAAPSPMNTGSKWQAGGVRVTQPSSITDAERAQRMGNMNMERGWFRGGPEPVNGKRTGPWYTQSADEAAAYARRYGSSGDVREYAIPQKGFLNASSGYSSRLAHDVAKIVDTDAYGKQGQSLAKELRTYGADENVTGGALWQALESRFGNDGAASVFQGLGFKGAKGITGGPEAYVFSNGAVRDANKAVFDPARASADNIYGRSTPGFTGLLGAGAAGAAYLARRDQ